MTTNKTNIWLWAIPSSWALSHVSLPSGLWMSKPGNSVTAFSRISPCFSDPVYLWLYEAAEREGGRGDGARGMMNTLSFRFVHVFSSLSIFQQKTKKKRNVLVVYSCHTSATAAKSSNMCYHFCFYVLRFLFLRFQTQYLMVIGGGAGLGHGTTTAMFRALLLRLERRLCVSWPTGWRAPVSLLMFTLGSGFKYAGCEWLEGTFPHGTEVT